MVEDFEISEEAEFEEKGFSINEIILRHIKKISDICCQELTGGYWEKKPVKTQSGLFFTETYHQDVRQAYCNAVDFLIDVVYPKSDNELRMKIDSYEQKIEIEDIKERLKQKRIIFKEINKMFERTNFWKTSISSNE